MFATYVRRNRPPNVRPRESISSLRRRTHPTPSYSVMCCWRRISTRETAPSEWICQFVGLSGDQDPFRIETLFFQSLETVIRRLIGRFESKRGE